MTSMNERYLERLKAQARAGVDRQMSDGSVSFVPKHQPGESETSALVIDHAQAYLAFRLRDFGMTYKVIGELFGLTLAETKALIEKGAP
jgi:hypothetical protein